LKIIFVWTNQQVGLSQTVCAHITYHFIDVFSYSCYNYHVDSEQTLTFSSCSCYDCLAGYEQSRQKFFVLEEIWNTSYYFRPIDIKSLNVVRIIQLNFTYFLLHVSQFWIFCWRHFLNVVGVCNRHDKYTSVGCFDEIL